MSSASEFEQAILGLIRDNMREFTSNLERHPEDGSDDTSAEATRTDPNTTGTFIRLPPGAMPSFSSMINSGGNFHSTATLQGFIQTSTDENVRFPPSESPQVEHFQGGLPPGLMSALQGAQGITSSVPMSSRFVASDGRDVQVHVTMQRIQGDSNTMMSRLGEMEGFLREMLTHLSPDNSTSALVIKEFKKVLLDTSAGKSFSIKQLKDFLRVFDVDHCKFVEKDEFVNALSEHVTFMSPSQCFGSEQEHICTICASPIGEGDLATKLPCGHWFHYGSEKQDDHDKDDNDQCLGVIRWLCKNSTCPNCKFELPKQRDIKSTVEKHAVSEPPSASDTIDSQPVIPDEIDEPSPVDSSISSPTLDEQLSMDSEKSDLEHAGPNRDKPEIDSPDGSKRQRSA